VQDRVVAVEVLGRPDVKGPLDLAMPLSNAQRSQRLACPACGFLTVPEASYGSYNICEVCGWEDDGVQLANPASAGGANRSSLVDAQDAAVARFPVGVLEAGGIRRSPRWRPLTPSEVALASAQREEKHWTNSAIVDAAECYWLRPRR
jgi:hypothetical protein